jgi:hypothetical protein
VRVLSTGGDFRVGAFNVLSLCSVLGFDLQVPFAAEEMRILRELQLLREQPLFEMKAQ